MFKLPENPRGTHSSEVRPSLSSLGVLRRFSLLSKRARFLAPDVLRHPATFLPVRVVRPGFSATLVAFLRHNGFRSPSNGITTPKSI